MQPTEDDMRSENGHPETTGTGMIPQRRDSCQQGTKCKRTMIAYQTPSLSLNIRDNFMDI